MVDPGEMLEDEYEEVEEDEEFDEAELLDDENEDPDFEPEDAEDAEDAEDEETAEEDEEAGSSEGDISDTNAPYAEAAEASQPASKSRRGISIPNPLRLLSALRPRSLVSLAQGQGKRVQRLVWRLEDASAFTAKFAVKAVVKGVRPAIVWLVVSRALRTIDRSQDLGLKMLKQPTHKQMDYYYSKLLGKDWQQQLEQDFIDAVAEVDGGYITDDMVRDRRGMQAAIMRRLEVEEWDKERMRHFYYGLYGMGPWYWDMEERLHNPFFIGARGWNGPPESWIGENQTFHADFDPKDRDFRLAAALALGELRGKPLSDEALRRVVSREEVRGVHQLMGSGRLQGLGLDPLDVVQRVEQQQAAEKQQQQQQPA